MTQNCIGVSFAGASWLGTEGRLLFWTGKRNNKSFNKDNGMVTQTEMELVRLEGVTAFLGGMMRDIYIYNIIAMNIYEHDPLFIGVSLDNYSHFHAPFGSMVL